MEVFINKPDGYSPFGPQDDHIISHAKRKVNPVEVDSLFYINNPEAKASEITTISSYQEWVETGWKQKHGTYEAASRFTGKLIEESLELSEAHQIFQQNGSDCESTDATELLSELGDVLWCATALASNSSADIDAAMKKRMYAYTMGIFYYDETARIPVTKNDYLDNGFRFKSADIPWRDQAANLATKFSDVTLPDVDELISAGFEPLPSPAMNIPAGEPFSSVPESIMLLMFDSVTLRGCVDQQFHYGETEHNIVMNYDEKAQDIAVIVSEVYLNVAYVAQHSLGLKLDDVITKNMAKLNARIKAGRVDKTDGERKAELL